MESKTTQRIPFSKRHLDKPAWKRDIPKGSEWITNIVKYGNKEFAGLRGEGNKFESEAEREELEYVKEQKNEINEDYKALTPREKRKPWWKCSLPLFVWPLMVTSPHVQTP